MIAVAVTIAQRVLLAFGCLIKGVLSPLASRGRYRAGGGWEKRPNTAPPWERRERSCVRPFCKDHISPICLLEHRNITQHSFSKSPEVIEPRRCTHQFSSHPKFHHFLLILRSQLPITLSQNHTCYASIAFARPFSLHCIRHEHQLYWS
jgi:hypothetical protein